MLFKKIGSPEARVASTSGHVIVIGKEFVDIPEHLIPDAYGQGCISEEVYNSIKRESVSLVGGLSVEEAIINMVNAPETGDFTGTGLPDLRRLKSLCNRSVTRDEMMVAWDKISAEK